MIRRTPLRRLTPLRARTPLKARTAPTAKSARAAIITPCKAARDTGPSRLVRNVILVRDNWQCIACGKPVGGAFTWWSIQHRLARGHGGANDLSNLILLCGSATSDGCHLKCEQRDLEMRAMGYWLESWQNPAAEPVMVHSEHGSRVMVWLTPDGQYSTEPPGEMAS